MWKALLQILMHREKSKFYFKKFVLHCNFYRTQYFSMWGGEKICVEPKLVLETSTYDFVRNSSSYIIHVEKHFRNSSSGWWNSSRNSSTVCSGFPRLSTWIIMIIVIISEGIHRKVVWISWTYTKLYTYIFYARDRLLWWAFLTFPGMLAL